MVYFRTKYLGLMLNNKTTFLIDFMKTIEHSLVDVKYLEIIDFILQKNIEIGILPETDRQMATEVYPGSKSFISALRLKHRHVPMKALENLARIFDVNMNFLFKNNEPIGYIPDIDEKELSRRIHSKYDASTVSKKKKQAIEDQSLVFKANMEIIYRHKMELASYLEKHQKDIPDIHYAVIKDKIKSLDTDLENLIERLEKTILLKELEMQRYKKKEKEVRRRIRKDFDESLKKEVVAMKKGMDELNKTIKNLSKE